MKISQNIIKQFSTSNKLLPNNILQNLRKRMKKEGYDGYILLNSDSHKNEYLAEKDKKIKSISNFSGSNAIVLITLNEAILWTDSRYYIQAEIELDKSYWKMIPIENTESDIKNFINENIEQGKKIGVDLKILSVNYYDTLKSTLKNHFLISDENNIIESVTKDLTSNLLKEKKNIFLHELKYTGKSPREKFKDVRRNLEELITLKNINKNEIKSSTAFAIILNKLDDIAWLTNLRGGDIQFNPVFFSYAVLFLKDENECLQLYVDEEKFSDSNLNNHFKENHINILPYEKFYEDLKNIPDDYFVIIDKISCNQSIYANILNNDQRHLLLDINVVECTKAIKNQTELEGFRQCHKRDGAAIVRYLAWLEDQIVNRKNKISEYEGARKLYSIRKENELFIDESFDTISSSGDNSAIIHYKPDKKNCKMINQNEIYLLDSGGHYLDGTTDTTRVIHFGNPSEREKEMYTRVLLGNLSIERLLFNKKKKISGSQIDILARQYLWRIGEDFGHGTGHGVGHFLNVHEGPHGISPKSTINLQSNMIVTNEPGFYLKDNFGIRIENILIIKQHKNFRDLLYFENVTQVNYEPNLIDHALLSKDMIEYINSYHHSVFQTLEKYLKAFNDEMALDYLRRKTKYL